MPLVGAAGVSLAFAGGAYATAPTEPTPPQDTTPRPIVTLGEEEISDVNLATFYAFDKENVEFGDRVQLARRGCGGCGCRGCARACRGCGCGGCRGCAVRSFGCAAVEAVAAPPAAGCGLAGPGSGSASGTREAGGRLPPPAAVSGAVTSGERGRSSFEARAHAGTDDDCRRVMRAGTFRMRRRKVRVLTS